MENMAQQHFIPYQRWRLWRAEAALNRAREGEINTTSINQSLHVQLFSFLIFKRADHIWNVFAIQFTIFQVHCFNKKSLTAVEFPNDFNCRTKIIP